jgi:hypothetical protein
MLWCMWCDGAETCWIFRAYEGVSEGGLEAEGAFVKGKMVFGKYYAYAMGNSHRELEVEGLRDLRWSAGAWKLR